MKPICVCLVLFAIGISAAHGATQSCFVPGEPYSDKGETCHCPNGATKEFVTYNYHERTNIYECKMPKEPQAVIIEKKANPKPSSTYSQKFQSRDEALNSCNTGLVEEVVASDAPYWICRALPPATKTAKEIFEEIDPGKNIDISKEYTKLTEQPPSHSQNPFRAPEGYWPQSKAGDASASNLPPLAKQQLPTQKRRDKNALSVCPPNPAACLERVELGGRLQNAFYFRRTCPRVKLAFNYQLCDINGCKEESDQLNSSDTTWISYNSLAAGYPAAYNVRCYY